MNRLTPEQRLKIVQFYFKNNGSVRNTCPDFHKRILFSDQTHFWLNGYVNEQNCRIWSEANPQVYVETPLHPEKLTVWCALWAGGIIGPYFFKNDDGQNITVNGALYRAMITDFFIPELNPCDLGDIWFKQDGATSHTSHQSMDLLRKHFGVQIILRFGPVNWPPGSCDITSLDFFRCGYLKSKVPASIQALEQNITRVIPQLPVEMLEQFIEYWTQRMNHLTRSCGQYMKEIIFKK
ncbi:uncharacterized protein [Bactrocera oleae]|uniref:uncharacterized protein n=1 Tax=Bactrocera oleae TaxID=104688 RepID=UPI00387E5D21